MGISGPVLAFLTAALYVAFKGMFNWGEDAYAAIMLFLSAMLAVFPAVKSHYKPILKVALWPVATVMIFATAWGASSGMSAGEEAMSTPKVTAMPAPVFAMAPTMAEIPSGVPMAPVSTRTNRPHLFVRGTNNTVWVGPEISSSWTNKTIRDSAAIGSTIPDEEMFGKTRVHGGFFKRMR